MMIRALRAIAITAATLATSWAFAANMPSGKPEYMLVGIDTKVTIGDDGAFALLAPGTDAVAVVDIGTDPQTPRLSPRCR